MFNTLPKIHIKHLNWLMPLLLSGLMSGSSIFGSKAGAYLG